MGGDHQSQAKRSPGDGADFGRIEMALEAAALLAEHASGRGDLDDIRASLRPVATPGGALVGAGFATAALGAAHEGSDPKNPGQVIAAAAGIGAIAGGQYVTEMRAPRTVYIAP